MHVPKKPFVLSSALDQSGRSVEELIFHKPDLLFNLINKDPGLKNHLEFYFQAGEYLQPLPLCHCKQNKVRNFVWLNNQPRYDLMSCDQPDCLKKLAILAQQDHLICPIKISVLKVFKDMPVHQRAVGRFLKNVIGLPREAHPDLVLQMFIQSYHRGLALVA